MMTIDGQSSYDHNKFIESSRYSAAKKRNGIRDFIEQDRRSKKGAAKPLTQYQHNNIIKTKKLVQRIEAELQAVNDFPRLMVYTDIPQATASWTGHYLSWMKIALLKQKS
jgi:hypothetical protein